MPYDSRKRRPRRRRIRDPFGRTREGPPPGTVLCHPSCKFFRCTKKALEFDRRTGRRLCKDAGDACIGGECRHASCAIHALLPDGRCRLALTSREEEYDEEELYEKFEREYEEEDIE